MFRHTVLNSVFSAIAQSASMAAILFLAAQLPVTEFGELILQLSYAALISAVLTFQFERVYVLQTSETLHDYVAFHLKLVSLVHLIAILPGVWLGLGASSILLGYGIALTQIANYSLARQGRFRRIWLLKVLQGATLLIGAVCMWAVGRLELVWYVFLLSNIVAAMVMFDSALIRSLRCLSPQKGLVRIRDSFPVAWKSLTSFSASTILRELPVYIAGSLGQHNFAAAYGLIVRTVGAPIGLIARSAAAVVSSYVAKGHFDLSKMFLLALVPAVGTVLVLMLYVVIPQLRMLDEYDGLRLVMALSSPYFLVKAYSGLLGPAIIYYGKQGLEVALNLVLLAFNVSFALLVLNGTYSLSDLLCVLSTSTAVLTLILVAALAKKISRVSLGKQERDVAERN